MMDADLTPDQRRRKDAFIAARGYWRPWTDVLLRTHPEFLERYARYAARPAEAGPLPARTVELVYVALDASATHLFASGLALHIGLALDKGARVAEIADVLRLATAQGLHGTFGGVRLLMDELAATGASRETALTPEQAALKTRCGELLGECPDALDLLLRDDPVYVERLLDLLDCPAPGEGLDETTRDLIDIALACCFTGYDEAAGRAAIRRALAHGVEVPAILQVLKMTAHLGVHACSVGLPALAAEANARASP
ncbi:carboxymuconolactone decarboxylase family protein [Acuticoccus sediminis]|nr:carboxymuconolactone decarboxylase family protein [Acuticoccus sediminis]